MSGLNICPIELLRDNYAYLVVGENDGPRAVVDPSDAEGVREFLQSRGERLDYILNTHHHWDHTDGNVQLKEMYGCQIVGPAGDRNRIPGIDLAVSEDEPFQFGSHSVKVLETPGHTRGGITYWFDEDEAAFTGDTLFSLGCGRLFEGSAEQMWQSLQKIRQLPKTTRIYCGHEYTAANVEFALSLQPESSELLEKQKAVKVVRQAGKPTIPSTLADEVLLNPFLRADCADLKKALSMERSSDVDVFAEVRARKDRF